MPKEMKRMKDKLYQKYGKYCEICGKKFKKEQLTGHHIIMRSKGGKVTEDNILITCYNCHFGTINHIPYDSKEYWDLMNKALEHRKSNK